MSDDAIIKVENLGKKYRIQHQQQSGMRYKTFREVITDNVRGLFENRKSKIENRKSQEDFWALKDVSFEVKRGEVVGIIGRNGAGKSTLLKILSRITEPTEGCVRLKGRVASLLEVGTGFHPELTGRENIYLNGAILGMSRAEITKKFDEIVAFAEVEQFLDTPVKRYSSGMYVRLAFAVAAHLEPEILIVDEVLAVGDAEFQKKCLGKMESVSRKEGRTVLFVSHNMDAVRSLCTVAVFLQNGHIQTAGAADKIIDGYLSGQGAAQESLALCYPEKPKTDFSIQKIEILEDNGIPKHKVSTWDRVRFRISFYSPHSLANGSVVLQIATTSGSRLFLASTQPDQATPVTFREGLNVVDCIVPKLMLSAGKYQFGAALAIPNISYLCDGFGQGLLSVEPKDVFGSGLSPQSARYLIPMECHWQQVPELTVGTGQNGKDSQSMLMAAKSL